VLSIIVWYINPNETVADRLDITGTCLYGSVITSHQSAARDNLPRWYEFRVMLVFAKSIATAELLAESQPSLSERMIDQWT
jgi:hypothetical protein